MRLTLQTLELNSHPNSPHCFCKNTSPKPFSTHSNLIQVFIKVLLVWFGTCYDLLWAIKWTNFTALACHFRQRQRSYSQSRTDVELDPTLIMIVIDSGLTLTPEVVCKYRRRCLKWLPTVFIVHSKPYCVTNHTDKSLNEHLDVVWGGWKKSWWCIFTETFFGYLGDYWVNVC